jgi:hypothetical protein
VYNELLTAKSIEIMKNFDSESENPKEKRREKFNSKKHQYSRIEDNDDLRKKNISKKELKKIKETYQEEEWEDWDRYYNH